ncbi:MAG: hypothetical protein QF599_05300 [Planctomycetota bacterium]|nr:hypothetical protein [Planctomycetota bacterium]MDP6955371.1 hypothetical protein [Planctomycetota bacterium]
MSWGVRRTRVRGTAPTCHYHHEGDPVKTLYILPTLLLALSSCGLPSLALHPRLGAMDVEGHLAANTDVAPVATTTDDLGLGEGEDEMMPRADFEWIGMHLSASQFTAAYSGSGQVTAEIDLGGDVIDMGEDVNTDLDLDVTSIHHTWDLIPGETVEAGIGLGVALIDFQTRMEAMTLAPGNKVETSESIPVPLLAARLGLKFGPVSISGVAGFLQISDGENEAAVTDLDIMAGYEVFSGTGASLGVNVGYRQFDFEANYDDGASTVDLDLGLSGIYYGISLAF